MESNFSISAWEYAAPTTNPLDSRAGFFPGILVDSRGGGLQKGEAELERRSTNAEPHRIDTTQSSLLGSLYQRTSTAISRCPSLEADSNSWFDPGCRLTNLNHLLKAAHVMSVHSCPLTARGEDWWVASDGEVSPVKEASYHSPRRKKKTLWEYAGDRLQSHVVFGNLITKEGEVELQNTQPLDDALAVQVPRASADWNQLAGSLGLPEFQCSTPSYGCGLPCLRGRIEAELT